MELSTELLKLIVCPVSKTPLKYDREKQELISEDAQLAFPVIEGVPILLVEKARKISSIRIASNVIDKSEAVLA